MCFTCWGRNSWCVSTSDIDKFLHCIVVRSHRIGKPETLDNLNPKMYIIKIYVCILYKEEKLS